MTTTWVNSGVTDKLTGDRIKTKAALKRALVAAPQHVIFDHTALGQTARFSGSEVAEILHRAKGTVAYTVVGPDPYNNRKWYATVRTNRLGNLVVT